jgi:hypothetical protein
LLFCQRVPVSLQRCHDFHEFDRELTQHLKPGVARAGIVESEAEAKAAQLSCFSYDDGQPRNGTLGNLQDDTVGGRDLLRRRADRGPERRCLAEGLMHCWIRFAALSSGGMRGESCPAPNLGARFRATL